jgi:CTP:molybdopterin cytidylyltransferase MocA/HD superfamily phosphohydrolase YqeK
MRNEKEIAALVLAAGYSSRAPGFKPLLPLGNGTVIEATIQNLRCGGVADITVVIGHHAAEMIPELNRLDVRYVLNKDYRKGMFSSVVAGVNSFSSQKEAFFLLPGDMPLVRSHTVRTLYKYYLCASAKVIYPVFRRQRGHPPLISTQCCPAITSWTQPEGLRSLLALYENEAYEVETADEGILMDIDSPEDYTMVSERFRHREIPTRNECEAILAKLNVPEGVVRHSRLVSEVARTLAEQLNQAGLRLDIGLVVAAGTLHDLAKGRAHHERLGARMLNTFGYRDVAAIIAVHRDIEFEDGQMPNEAAVLYLADKLVKGDRIVSIDERFQGALEKFARNGEVLPGVKQRLLNALAIGSAAERLMGKSLEQTLSEVCRLPDICAVNSKVACS